ncbi:unnamed protein product [Caenorhabditis bovis]|uniref:C-type lectin domain-containing protein n=1 Tax=Caenorhabditis bovis TaxID=2654633 RepID=A0A8S1F2K2_9PELO|nr:unnamed protein product [Caenorhabditis bovis]
MVQISKSDEFLQKANENQPDICNDANVQAHAKDDKEALKLCKKKLPYRVVKASKASDVLIKCTIQAEKKCLEGWYQIRDKCYQITAKNVAYSYEEANKLCKSVNGEIAKLTYSQLVNHFNLIFGSLSHIWVYIETDITKRRKGFENQILYGFAIGKYLPYGTTVLEDVKSVAQVICEYNPAETVPSLQAKLSRIAQFYYEGSVFDKKLVVQSVNKYMYNPSDNMAKLEKKCKSILNAFFVGPGHGSFYQNIRDITEKVTSPLTDHTKMILSTMRMNRNERKFCYLVSGKEECMTIGEPELLNNVLFDATTPTQFCTIANRQNGKILGVDFVNKSSMMCYEFMGLRAPMYCQSSTHVYMGTWIGTKLEVKLHFLPLVLWRAKRFE